MSSSVSPLGLDAESDGVMMDPVKGQKLLRGIHLLPSLRYKEE